MFVYDIHVFWFKVFMTLTGNLQLLRCQCMWKWIEKYLMLIFVGFKPFNRKLTFNVDREYKGCLKKKMEGGIDLIQSISFVTAGRSWGKLSWINLCGTGLRFGRNVSQNFSVTTYLPEISPALHVYQMWNGRFTCRNCAEYEWLGADWWIINGLLWKM